MPTRTKLTAFIRTFGLWLSAVAIVALGVIMEDGRHDAAALCGGRRYATSVVPRGASPYIELSADGVSGPFLLDYGSTNSSLSAGVFSATDGASRKAVVSLPGFGTGRFNLVRYDLLRQPETRQLGVIGADILSTLSAQFTGDVVFLGAQACDPKALSARGLVPIAQNGFFASDPAKIDATLPNVPVVFLRLGEVRAWAQIDTGYDDVAYPRSVDINQALYERLVESGARLQRVGDVTVWTCDGREDRPVYTLGDRPLTIENERAEPIVETETFHLIVKPVDGCGGIGEMAEPAAQLGASFLRLFGTTVFDPRSGTVWLDGEAGKPARGEVGTGAPGQAAPSYSK